jgi:uncharacterized protein YgiM (DUF1202 family)
MPTGLALSLALIAQQAAAQPKVSASYLCNTAKAASGLELRSGPGTKYAAIGRVADGASLYVCDKQGSWYHVFYVGIGKPCTGSTNGLEKKKSVSCKSGWAKRKDVNVLSG